MTIERKATFDSPADNCPFAPQDGGFCFQDGCKFHFTSRYSGEKCPASAKIREDLVPALMRLLVGLPGETEDGKIDLKLLLREMLGQETASVLTKFSVEERQQLLKAQAIVCCGLPGSGKSWVARHLKRALGIEHYLATDEIRRQLFPDAEGFNITTRYSSKQSQAVYDRLLQEAKIGLTHGQRVFLDGTFLDPRRVEIFQQLAEVSGQRPLVLVVQATEATIRHRFDQLAQKSRLPHDYSEATYETCQLFQARLAAGTASFPSEKEGVDIIFFDNNFEIKP